MLEFAGRGIDQRGLVIEDLADDHHLLIGLRPLLLFDGLAHGGDGFDAVARVVTRSIKLMPVPGTARESVGSGELALSLYKLIVDSTDRGAVECGAPLGFELRQSLLIALGSATESGIAILERREVEVGRN